MDKKFVCIVADMRYYVVQGVYINRMPSIYDIFVDGGSYEKPDVMFPGDNSKNGEGVLFLDDIIKQCYPPNGKADYDDYEDLFVISAIIEDGTITEAKLDVVIYDSNHQGDFEPAFVRLDINLPVNELQKKLFESIYTKWLVKPLASDQPAADIEVSEEEKKELFS